MRIHILYEHSADLRPHGCSHIRLLRPLTHPSVRSLVETSSDHRYFDTAADAVIVERTWRPDITLTLAQKLLADVRKRNVAVIYSIDDNLLDLSHERYPSPCCLSVEQKAVVRFLAREADGILVSTTYLKERLCHMNKKILVVPNAIDEQLLGRRGASRSSTEDHSNRRTRKVIGYMGTCTHDNDVMMVLWPLREVLRRYHNEWELQIIGGIANRTIMQAFQGLPCKVIGVPGGGEYPHFMAWFATNVSWDVAIAPLEDNAVTRCKSDLKFLDYSALGIAGVYSRVPAYEQTVRHLETGWLTGNSTDAWVEGLEALIGDQDLRVHLAERAREYVYSYRTLEHCAHLWVDAIRSILEM